MHKITSWRGLAPPLAQSETAVSPGTDDCAGDPRLDLFSALCDFGDPSMPRPLWITEVQTRFRVGYIDLLETQIKTEMNMEEMEGEYCGDGVWPSPRAV